MNIFSLSFIVIIYATNLCLNSPLTSKTILKTKWSLQNLKNTNPIRVKRQFSFTPTITLNLKQMADSVFDPALDNLSLRELYNAAEKIINGTNAETVLFELDPINNNTNNNNNSSAEPILMMAVVHPDESSQDPLDRFRLYFVNISQTNFPQKAFLSTSDNNHNNFPLLSTITRENMWESIRNFFRNQAHAVVGAFWLPFRVASQAMQQVSSDHAQYVMAGTTLGSAISKPIILTAIHIPNNIAEIVVNITTTKANAVKLAEQQSKQSAEQVVDAVANVANVVSIGMTNGVNVSDHAVQYLARPIGAFVGLNLSNVGKTLSTIGQYINNTGNQIVSFGKELSTGAQNAVSHGATAITWGLDNKVVLFGEHPQQQQQQQFIQAGNAVSMPLH